MRRPLLLCSVLFLFGCSENPPDPTEKTVIPETKSSIEKAEPAVFERSDFGLPLTLGEKIQNPHSVKILREALDKLGPSARGGMRETDIVPTHRYIRLLPENTNEYVLLLKTIRPTPFPLDRKIMVHGTFYRDPDPANEGKPYSWQYAVVPVGQPLPDVTYEVLDELYMAENDIIGQRSVSWQHLELKAAELAGRHIGNAGVLTKSVPPTLQKVVVRVWDDTRGFERYIPVQGLAVNAVDLDKGAGIAYGITNEMGMAAMNRSFTVTENIFYSISWYDGKGWKWITTDTDNNQLFYNVKAVDGTTYVDIKGPGIYPIEEQALASIHRAAYRTYYKANSDLLPPANEETIQIAYDDTRSNEHLKGVYYGYVPGQSMINIKIFGRTLGGGKLYPPLSIFYTTVHELGHLSHYVGFSDAFLSDKIIKESWATCVQKYLTQYEYESYGYSIFEKKSLPRPGYPGPPTLKEYVMPNYHNAQKWPYSFGSDLSIAEAQKNLPYSPVFIDLIDDENQREYFQAVYVRNNTPGVSTDEYLRFPQDNVKNFTLGELQNWLKNTKTLEELKEKVKNASNLHGNTVSGINALFTKFTEYWNLYDPPQNNNGITGPDGGIILYD